MQATHVAAVVTTPVEDTDTVRKAHCSWTSSKAKARESLIRDSKDVLDTPTLTEKGRMRVFRGRSLGMTTDHFPSPHQSPE